MEVRQIDLEGVVVSAIIGQEIILLDNTNNEEGETG